MSIVVNQLSLFPNDIIAKSIHVVQPKAQLRALTSLRFFAAMMIVALHAQGHFGIPAGFANRYALGGGVSIFFVLSGFILAYVYPELPSANKTWRFLLARFARIWPAHIATSAFAVWLIWGGFFLDGDALAHALINVGMLHAWSPWTFGNVAINGPSWSISTEFMFYLLFPLLIADFRRTWWWKLALSLCVAGVLIIICEIFAIPHADSSRRTGTALLLYQFPLARLSEFVIGMCAALAWQTYAARLRINRFIGTIFEVAALLILLYTLTSDGTEDISRAFWSWYYQSFHYAIPAALLIFVLACDVGWVSRLMSLAPLVFLGEISYSMYLIHFPLLQIHWAYTSATVPLWVQAGTYFCALYTLSYLIWACVEMPMRNLLIGRTNRLQTDRFLRSRA
ncbi:MAG: hypothetical protein QOI12_2765 [Alphaproteobacteria bacterium]|nr:hypothetical protein [Alphaproteobacteria bacterium]